MFLVGLRSQGGAGWQVRSGSGCRPALHTGPSSRERSQNDTKLLSAALVWLKWGGAAGRKGQREKKKASLARGGTRAVPAAGARRVGAAWGGHAIPGTGIPARGAQQGQDRSLVLPLGAMRSAAIGCKGCMGGVGAGTCCFALIGLCRRRRVQALSLLLRTLIGCQGLASAAPCSASDWSDSDARRSFPGGWRGACAEGRPGLRPALPEPLPCFRPHAALSEVYRC